jgi:hypothetical protein
MKVSNSQTSDTEKYGVSRDTLNDWQRKDAAKNSKKINTDADQKEANKQAEG